MPTAAEPPVQAGRLEILGAATCEDTAIVRSRLEALGVAYAYHDVDRDPAALTRVRALNDGHRVTPTVIAGEDVTAEPTLERLGDTLAAMHITSKVAEPVQLHGDVTSRAIPLRTRPNETGSPFDLATLRGRRQVCLFLAHDHACQACFGYARQLAGHVPALDAANASLAVVGCAAPEALDEWRHGLPPEATLVADPDGAWHAAIESHLGFVPGSASLVLLDRFLAPRVVASAAEAGGLPDPTAAISWLEFLELECPECSGELPWPTSQPSHP